MIAAGKRDRRVDVLKRVDSRGPAGDTITTYALRRRVWAAVLGRTGRERFAADQDTNPWDVRINTLYFSDIATTDKLVVSGQRFDVAFIAEQGRREGLEILGTKDLT